MEDLIRANALLISEDDVEEPFDEEADGIENPMAAKTEVETIWT